MSSAASTASWHGVFPAVTTKFTASERLDIPLMEKHFNRQIDAGTNGLVVLGSLGENGSLTWDEKLDVLRTAVRVSAGRVPVLACVAETTTATAREFVEAAQKEGANGFMLLPPMRYQSDRRETLEYLRSVATASDQPIMLYNNPVAYRVDITPDMFAELADESRFAAIKESSDNVRRITDIVNLVGHRYKMFIGVDDLAFEALLLGADGWLAGLVCAFPKETVTLYRLITAGRIPEALQLYRWFTPLLHLDVSVKFVQYIKLAEAMTGEGTEYVRAPRLPLSGEERRHIEQIIDTALATRPQLPSI